MILYFSTSQLKGDMYKWSNQLHNGNTLQEVTDLPTLTHFLEVMQVKYGSRWLALLINVPNQDFLIEDPEEFAQKLFGMQKLFYFKFQKFISLCMYSLFSFFNVSFV